MAKNLGAAVIDLLEHDRIELRVAAATVLAHLSADSAVQEALIERLADSDANVRRISLEGLASAGTTGIAAKLVPLLRGNDDGLAERAAQLLASQGAGAEAALRKEVGQTGPVPARRVMAQLLLRRGTQPAIEAVIDQLDDREFGEQALQLVRAALDANDPAAEKLATLVDKVTTSLAGEAGKRVAKEWARAQKAATAADAAAKAASKSTKKKAGTVAAPVVLVAADPLRDADVIAANAQLSNLLRLIGYLAKPSNQSLLLGHASEERPRPIRLAAIAGLRRLVAQSEAKGVEHAIAALIDYADGSDLAVAQSAIDTLRGARIPEKLAKEFASLAKSKNPAAQKLAMERLPAGGGAAAVKALIEALGGPDIAARDAASRGLAKAPEAVLPMARALVATRDEGLARRYASAIRAHRGNVSSAAVEELVDAIRGHIDAYFKNKATADSMVVERVIADLIADVAPARHVELLFDRAKRLRKAGKPVEAFGSLKPLLRSHADLDDAIDDDHRFLLAVLAVEAAGEVVMRSAHSDDPVLAQLSRLGAKGYPVAKKLAKEKDVSDEAIYGLGFRMLESKHPVNMELGAELLQSIVDERPRSKLAKNAKNKLKLSGYGEE